MNAEVGLDCDGVEVHRRRRKPKCLRTCQHKRPAVSTSSSREHISRCACTKQFNAGCRCQPDDACDASAPAPPCRGWVPHPRAHSSRSCVCVAFACQMLWNRNKPTVCPRMVWYTVERDRGVMECHNSSRWARRCVSAPLQRHTIGTFD